MLSRVERRMKPVSAAAAATAAVSGFGGDRRRWRLVGVSGAAGEESVRYIGRWEVEGVKKGVDPMSETCRAIGVRGGPRTESEEFQGLRRGLSAAGVTAMDGTLE